MSIEVIDEITSDSITRVEIRVVIFDMSAGRAPCVDGINTDLHNADILTTSVDTLHHCFGKVWL